MQRTRPVGLIVAVACSVLLGLAFIVFAAVSAAAGHGVFSIQIGVLLAAYGLILIGAAVGLWLLRRWARGPVAAFALMAGFGFGEYLLDQPWLWLLVLLCLGAVVGAALPSTTRALKERVRPADRPPQRA
ncbi:MAG TPA: hypothetical protein PKE46_14795 [Micropruina sp.]|nr:hypothetical protein [Propionibacterium sp.]HMQ37961.1 hypothetical protein [Micropruina sp.]HMR23400.1 hypothetical protein [Micropruina sp.]